MILLASVASSSAALGSARLVNSTLEPEKTPPVSHIPSAASARVAANTRSAALPADRLDAWPDVAHDRRWAAVEVSLGGRRGTDRPLDWPRDLDDPLAFRDQGRSPTPPP